jgi:hypothetical protein
MANNHQNVENQSNTIITAKLKRKIHRAMGAFGAKSLVAFLVKIILCSDEEK